MDDEKSHDSDKNIDEIMLPGFRFHPTDEELVEFYLKRKLQHRSLPIELIKQVDIYKYDPWDLPKLASTGEKEWYFYCPRDRKYKNSTRPNRVTGSGFWKATGTDRPIYSSDGSKCIGLKKSLVFYRGRAAKGIKTDWMMHEFRLPSTTDGGGPPPPPPPKKIFDKTFPHSDSWAICRIFKKISSMANRAVSHTPWQTATESSEPFTYTTPISNPENQQTNFSLLNIPSYRNQFPLFSPQEQVSNNTSTVDLSSMLFGLGPGEACKNTDFEMPQNQFYSINSPQVVEANMYEDDDEEGFKKNETNILNMWENIKSIGFPFSLPQAVQPWDSPPCPSEVSSTTHSTNKSIYS